MRDKDGVLPQAHPHGWIIVCACVIAQMAALGLTINCFTLFLRYWTVEFAAPVSSLVIAVTLFSIAAGVVNSFIGIAVDRFPARWLFASALLTLSLFHLAMSFIGSTLELVGLYVLVLPVVAAAAGAVSCQAIVSRWFSGTRHFGLALGISAMGAQIAGIVLSPLVAAFLPTLGWRSIFQAFALVIAVVALPLILIVMREPHRAPSGGGTKQGSAPADAVGAASDRASDAALTTMGVLRNRTFWLMMAAFFPAQAAGLALFLNLGPMLAARGFDARTTSVVLVATSATAMLAKIGAGTLADRLGNRLPMVGVTAATACGYLILASSGTNILLFGTGAVLIGICGGAWPLAASVIAREFGPTGFGRAFGLAMTIIALTSFAPPVFAFSQELFGTYVVGLLAGFALVAAGSVAAFGLDSRRA